MGNRVYLSGPMTGYPDFNYNAFHDAAEFLRGQGFDVFNPAESFDGDKTKDRTEYMRLDLAEVTKCTHIAMLPGWVDSRGACAEMRVACECGLDIICAQDGCVWEQHDVDRVRDDVARDMPLLSYDSSGWFPEGVAMSTVEAEARLRNKTKRPPAIVSVVAAENQQFATGAVRDTQEGKPRPDLNSPFASYRMGVHLGASAGHYGERNWEKGIPMARSMASLIRHLDAFRRGETDEDHLAAVNVNAMFMLDHDERIKRGLLPAELNDMPVYEPVEVDLEESE